MSGPHHLVFQFRPCPLPWWLPRPVSVTSSAVPKLGSSVQRASTHHSPASGPRASPFASLRLGFLDNKIGVTVGASPSACFQDDESRRYEELKPLMDVAVGIFSLTWTALPLLTRSLAPSCPQHICTRIIKGPVTRHNLIQDTEQSPAVSYIPQPFWGPPEKEGLLPLFHK